MRRNFFAFITLLFATLLLISSTPAPAADNPPKPPKVKFNLDSTPLQVATDQDIESRKNKNREIPACDEAVRGNKHDDIVTHCKVPKNITKLTKTGPTGKEIKGADGKLRGKRVETETTYECDTPEQCGMVQWPGYTVKPEQLDPEGGDPQNNAASLRVRRVVTANSTEINNDLDCIDTLTREHHGGFVKDENGHYLIGQTYPNGHEQSCFDSQGNLKQNLAVIPGGCQHPNGTTFEAEECTDRGYTTLEELKDEDPPAVAGQPAYDRDGDGVAGEDGPDTVEAGGTTGAFGVAANETPCVQKGGLLLDDGTCDFRRKVRLEIKNKMSGHGKGWKIDANGDCDPNADGDWECGQEPRRITRTEWYEVRCPEESEYIDGRCLVPTSDEEIVAMRESGIITPQMAPLLLSESTDKTVSTEAMMGFTWALPKVKWGIDETQEVCIFVCWEVYAFRFGYEFDLAFGLRLPVQVEVSPPEGTPTTTTAVLAGDQKTYTAKLTPIDFTVQQYKDFCIKHRLAEKGKIPSCDRFAFPDYWWDRIVSSSHPEQTQGAEFVMQAIAWAGTRLRLVGITVFDISVGVDLNIPAMCTMWKVYNKAGNPIGLVVDLVNGRDWLTAIDDNMLNCGTFVTPFGYKRSVVNPTEKILRSFPFLTGDFTIDADCAIAKTKGWVAKFGEAQIPLCTHLSYYGVGVGLKLAAAAGSTHIGADWSVSGDARPTDAGPLDFYDLEATGPNAPPIGPVHFDNHDLTTDEAQIKLNNFKYHLDTLQFRLEAVVQLLNISVVGIPIYTLEFEGLGGPSFGQHPGTDPLQITIPVKNYGLTVQGTTAANDPKRLDDKTLLIKPGDFGYFQVAVKNEGTETDSFSNFARQLTNIGNQAGPPFLFVMNHNNDLDCTDLAGTTRYRGAAECYTPEWAPRSDRIPLVDEDGPGPGSGTVASRDTDRDGYADEDPANDDWLSAPNDATFHAQSITGVAKHSLSTTTLTLGVKPFLHPLTAPGVYPVSIKADSLGAIAANLTGDDASQIKRVGAEDFVYVRVDSFYDPKIALTPPEASVRPGEQATFAVETSNGGNSEDTIQLLRTFLDSNRSGCTLTNLGAIPADENSGCPYRAVVTMIPSAQWTDIASLANQFERLAPLASGQGQFTIRVPREWAGMQDTTYEIAFVSQSSMPSVHNGLTLKYNVLATKESMTRYIVLEVAEFLAELQKADAQGVRARGAEPVTLHPISMMVNKALEQVLAGQPDAASKTLSSAGKVMAAVDRMVNGANLPPPYASDWKLRTAAMLADLSAAQAK